MKYTHNKTIKNRPVTEVTSQHSLMRFVGKQLQFMSY